MPQQSHHRYLFQGIVEYAHPAVWHTHRHVLYLKEQWLRLLHKNDSSIRNIKRLVGIIGSVNGFDHLDAKRRDDIFAYFSAATIYANYLLLSSCLREKDLTQLPCLTPEVVTLCMLNEKARNIIDHLLYVTYPKPTQLENASTEEKEKHLSDNSGRFTRFHKVGHIPCLVVRTDDNCEVGLRKGFELKRKGKNRTKSVTDHEQRLKEFPMRVYVNGQIQAGYIKDEGLKEILSDKDDINHLLLHKHITWIHKEYSSFDRNFVTYLIDVAESEKVTRDSEVDADAEKELDRLAGEKRSHLEHCSCEKQDVIITYFANELYHIPLNNYNRDDDDDDDNDGDRMYQDLEKWSRLSILDYINNKNSKMYIGFDFGTIQDAQYCNKGYVSGSTNLLLLALTRGLLKLHKNLCTLEHNQEDYESEYEGCDRLYEDHTRINLLPDDFQSVIGDRYKPCEPSKKKVRVVEDNEELFLGANSSGILVKLKKYPKRFWFITGASVLVWGLFGSMLVIYEKSSVDRGRENGTPRLAGYVRIFGAVIELWSAFLAFLVIVLSCCFARWEFRDMISFRRRASNLSELIVALGHNRERAVRMCAKLKNPATIFSNHDSCGFTERGEGEIEIDKPITVRDLQGSSVNEKGAKKYCPNYKFGVNYQGEPVMSDANGNVRKIKYPSNDEKGILHIAGEHEYGLKYIMELPTKNVHVGSRRKRQLL